MQNLNLEKLSRDIEAFVQERDWDQFHSIKNLSMALTIEASELMELFQWVKEEDSNQVKENEEKFLKLQDEVADVFIYLLRIVRKADIDLESAIREKMRKNALKYPVELSRGNSKKYDEL